MVYSNKWTQALWERGTGSDEPQNFKQITEMLSSTFVNIMNRASRREGEIREWEGT